MKNLSAWVMLVIMPEVFREDGFSVVVYPADHIPPHVHVWKASGEVKILLGDAETAPSLDENLGMSKKDARRALTLVIENLAACRAKWEEIHG